MSENFKSQKYVNLNTNSVIKTNGDLEEFIQNNLHLKEDELIHILKKYLAVGISTDDIYIKSTITKLRRIHKIKNVLNSEDE